ncbi:hypothetical protein POPTR_010G129101v4 [Populus trichocarpa]|uniref:Uncharacterized protein n=1 Tax=Populus trichocarpa TaxID=3694 RepID=A0A3N7GF16_POPTR|nr:hypothetical protein BDE02_10G115000 [Populus trichocarpa]RQO96620.1 hypothetical protein POPTR_010G129101v4 [Populus trichocarpa]
MPGDIPKPPSNELPETSSEHQIHDSEWIVKMRAACELAAHVLENAGCFKFSYACHAGRIIFWKANFYPSNHNNKFLQLSWNSQSVCLTGVASCQLTCFLGVMNEHALMGIFANDFMLA